MTSLSMRISDNIPREDSSSVDLHEGIPWNAENIDTYSDLISSLSSIKKILVLVFSTPTCTPCKKLKQRIYSSGKGIASRESEKVQFVYINVQENEECCSRFHITRIPLVCIGRISDDGERFETQKSMTGNQLEELERYLHNM